MRVEKKDVDVSSLVMLSRVVRVRLVETTTDCAVPLHASRSLVLDAERTRPETIAAIFGV